jgi:predicted MFS family arabinose efflux permease
MTEANQSKRLWLPTAIALFIQGLAMTAFWIIASYFGDQSQRTVQVILLVVGIGALASVIAFGSMAIRKSKLKWPAISFLVAGLALGMIAFGFVYVMGSAH